MIRRGAYVVKSEGAIADVDHVACENPDGEKVLVVTNRGRSRPVGLHLGPTTAELTLAGNSVTTLKWK
jgi:O-glycosyl hydrolase